MISRRRFLAGAAAAVATRYVHAWSAPLKLADFLPPDHVTDGGVDYSSSVQRAYYQLRDYGGGELILPRSTSILIADVETFANIETRGEDGTAVLKVKHGHHGLSLNPGEKGTPDPADNARNVAFRNFTMVGAVSERGFYNHRYLLNLNAFTNVEVEDMAFLGFQCDGLFCGSSNIAAVERHNFNLTVRRSHFDGINRDNRNAISLIDITGATVEDCEFRRCSRPEMPGPIDMEPDDFPFGIICDVTIGRCTFRDNGGEVGEVAVAVPAGVKAVPRQITVEDCTSDGYKGTGSFFRLVTFRTPDSPTTFDLLRNTVRSGSRPYALTGAADGRIRENRFSDCTQFAMMGGERASWGVRDLLSTDNVYERCGSRDGVALLIGWASRVHSLRDRFVDCGSGVPEANAISFGPGRSAQITLERLQVSSPTGKTRIAIYVDRSHTLEKSTTKLIRPMLGTLPSRL